MIDQADYGKYFGNNNSGVSDTPTAPSVSANKTVDQTDYEKYFGKNKETAAIKSTPDTSTPLAPGPRIQPAPKQTISAPTDTASFERNAALDTGPNSLRSKVYAGLSQLQQGASSVIGQMWTSTANTVLNTIGKNFAPTIAPMVTALDNIKSAIQPNASKNEVTPVKSIATFAKDTLSSVEEIGYRGQQAISAVTKKNATPTERVNGLLNAGIAAVDASFLEGMTQFNAAKGVLENVPGGQTMMKPANFAMEKLTQAGQWAAPKIVDMIPDSIVSPQMKEDLKSNVAELGGQLALALAFHAVGSATDMAVEYKSARDVTSPMSSVIGLDPRKTPSKSAIETAYKKTMDQIGATNDPMAEAHAQLATTAYHALKDFHELSPEDYQQKWVATSQAMANAVPELRNKTQESVAAVQTHADAASAIEARQQPIAEGGGTKAYDKLKDSGKLAYEVESVDNFKRTVAEEQQKAPNQIINTYDNPFDTKPGTFDPQTGEIGINMSAVMDLADRAEKGQPLIVGEGRTQYILELKKGETRAELESRIIRDIIAHETAHLDTVRPEDAIAMKTAIETGDQAALDKIKSDLEERANRVMKQPTTIESHISEAMKKEGDRIDAILSARAQMEAMKFDNVDLENGYKRWRDLARNNPDIRNLDYAGLRDRLQNKSGYRKEGAVENRFGLSTLTDVTHDAMLDKFRERLSKESKVRETARQSISQSLPGTDKGQVSASKAVRDEVKAILKEQKNKEKAKALAEKRLAQFNDILPAKDVVASGKESTARQLAAQENKYKSLLSEQSSILRSEGLMDRAILRVQKENIINGLRDKATAAKDVRRQIVEYYRENVPPAMRGDVAKSLIIDLKNATSRTDLEAVFRKIDSEFNRAERKKLNADIKDALKETELKTVNGRRRGKYGENQPILDKIREVVKLPRKEGFEKRVELIRSRMDPNTGMTDLSDADLLQSEIYQAYGVKEQTNSQLRATLSLIERLKEGGKSDARIRMDKMREKSADIRARLVQEVTGGIKKERSTLNTQRPTDSIVRRFWNETSLGPMLADEFARYSTKEAGNSDFSRLAHESYKHESERMKMTESDTNALSAGLKEIYGKDKAELSRELAKIGTDVLDIGKFKDANGEELNLQLTRGQAIKAVASLRHPDTLAKIMSPEGNAWTPEIVDAVKKALSPEDTKAMELLLKAYKDKHQPFSDAALQATGAPLNYVESYMPRRMRTLGEENVPAPADMLKRGADVATATPSSTKSRSRGTKGEILFTDNPFVEYLSYAEEANHYITHAEYIGKLNRVFSDHVLRDAIIEAHGQSAWDSFQHWMDNMKRNGIDKKLVNSTLAQINNNLVSAVVNSPMVISGQPAAIGLFAAHADNQAGFYRGLLDFALHPKQSMKDIQEISSFVRERGEKQLGREIRAERDKNAAGALAGTHTVREWLAKPLDRMDKLVTAAEAHAFVYQEREALIKKGHSTEAATRLAVDKMERVGRETLSTSGHLAQSKWETSGTLMKMLTTLQSEANKNAHQTFRAIAAAKEGRLSMKKAARIIIYNSIITPLIYTALRRGAADAYYAAYDKAVGTTEEEKKKRDAGKASFAQDFAGNAIANTFGFLILGDLLKSLGGRLIQGNTFSYTPTVLLSSLNTMLDTASNINQGDFRTAFLQMINSGAAFAGIPFSQNVGRAIIKSSTEADKAQHAYNRKFRIK